MAKYLNLTGLQTLWEKIKAVFAPKENGVYYVPGTSGYANWAANTAYAVGANVVNPSGECWTCKTAHTSGSSWSSTSWNRISAVALTGTIDGVTALYAGLKIAYRFQVLGGEDSTTLNVNNLGAKTITRGTGAFYRWTIGRNGVAILVYDGSAWRFGDYDSNDQYVLPEAYCSTAAGTQAKAAISVGFSYSRHNNIPFRIYFTNANTYNGNLTLDVNSQGAKPLWINGSASSSSNKTIAVGVYWCYYDGTQFQLWTDKSIWGLKFRGDGSNLTEAFTAASSRVNIATGDTNATIFGKIARWLGDLKTLAFKDKVGTGDVESGTYGISVSGNASTATNAGTGGNLSTAVSNSHTHSNKSVLDSITVVGTAATKDVPTSGNASTTQVVMGNDTRLTNSRTPTSHASTATTYGVGTTSNYGHVKLATGDMNGATHSDGVAVSKNHTHSQYLTSHQDISGKMNLQTVSNPNWNNLTTTGIYEITNSAAAGTNGSPESNRVTLVVINTNGYITQTAYGGKIYYRTRSSSGTWDSYWRVIGGSLSNGAYDLSMGSGGSNTLGRALSHKVEVLLEDGGAAQSGWKLCVSDSVGSDDTTIYFT